MKKYFLDNETDINLYDDDDESDLLDDEDENLSRQTISDSLWTDELGGQITKSAKNKSYVLTYFRRLKQFFTESPRITFVYDSFFDLLFLVLFSYTLLCEFCYYTPSSMKNNVHDQHSNISTTTANNASTIGDQMRRNGATIVYPSFMEYVLIFWIFTLSVDEIYQVSN